jgi:hypothetical protein
MEKEGLHLLLWVFGSLMKIGLKKTNRGLKPIPGKKFKS